MTRMSALVASARSASATAAAARRWPEPNDSVSTSARGRRGIIRSVLLPPHYAESDGERNRRHHGERQQIDADAAAAQQRCLNAARRIGGREDPREKLERSRKRLRRTEDGREEHEAGAKCVGQQRAFAEAA